MAGNRTALRRTRPQASVPALFRSAVELQQQGRNREAYAQFRAVLQAEPQHFGALCSLARLLFEQGAAAEALPPIDQALRQRPEAADAHHARACILQALGRVPEAVGAYEVAIRLQPDFPDACNNLGGLLAEQGRHTAALPLYGQALARRPDFVEAHNNIGVTLLALDQAEAALRHFDRAVALRPDFADAHGNRGSALVALGRIDEARGAFEAAIRLAPRNGRFYLDLVACGPLAPDDPHVAAMQALAAAAGMPAEARVELQFALAKALGDMGRLGDSFRHLRQGNALKRVGLRYDEAAALAAMRRIETLFGAEWLRSGGDGEPSSSPVFVVGMPRSGTTLVEQILASHPQVFGAGERQELHRTALAFAGAERPGSDLFAALAALPDERLRALGTAYVQAMAGLAPDAARIVDKMPGNFLLLGLVARALPNARVIHVRRDPVDTCLSCFATLFASDQPYAYNLGELGRYYRAYSGLMAHWRAALPSGLMLEVRYEDVVDDIEGQARRLVAHCGLDWDPRCLEFHATSRSVQTASRVQVRQKLYRSSVGRARAYGGLLGSLLQALGDAS